MANILKAGSTYAPQNNQGLDLTGSDYYGVIDRIEYNKADKGCYFAVDIYVSSTARSEGKGVVDRIIFSFNEDEFDEKIGSDGLTIPQAYAKSLETLTDWTSDES
jgi:hypothetical protein